MKSLVLLFVCGACAALGQLTPITAVVDPITHAWANVTNGGVGVAGVATINFMLRRNIDVIAADDRLDESKQIELRKLGIDVRSIKTDSDEDVYVVSKTKLSPSDLKKITDEVDEMINGQAD